MSICSLDIFKSPSSLSLGSILQCLEWLECQYETFILAHSDFHESPAEALALKNQYSQFLDKLEPTCVRVDDVLSQMSELRPQAPSLSSSIDQLCQVVSDRVKTLKGILHQCSDVLNTFAQFCALYKDVSRDGRVWQGGGVGQGEEGEPYWCPQ